MISDEELTKKRFIELADKAYKSSRFTFTDFLGLSEISLFYSIEREIYPAHYEMFGGTQGCERVIIRFGSEEDIGYSEPFPIVCLRIKPLAMKFSDDLTHRDILGSVMSMGIKRSCVGDIILKENIAYLFCLKSMGEYICENLFRVKHTSVSCEITTEIPDFYKTDFEERTTTVPSARIDAVISKVYNLSRSDSIELFREKKVFVNGRCSENNSYFLKADDVVTVRGRGRFIFKGENFKTRKGNFNITVFKTK